jgi:hypothetical protein
MKSRMYAVALAALVPLLGACDTGTSSGGDSSIIDGAGCTPAVDTQRCDGDDRLACDPLLQVWTSIEICPGAMTCVLADDGATTTCVPVETGGDVVDGGCSPAGYTTCDGNKVLQCGDDGKIAVVEDCVESGLKCEEGECGSGPVACAVVTPIKQITNQPTISSVAVVFAVDTCEGIAVVGLDLEDFSIYEDDKAISPTEAQATVLSREVEVYISLVMDNSPSVKAAGALEQAVEAALVFVGDLMTGTQASNVRVSVSFFSKKLELIQPFTSDLDSVQGALSSLLEDTTGSNTTNLYGAIIDAIASNDAARAFREAEMRGGTLPVGQVVLFTDGSDQAALYTLGAAQSAVNSTQADVLTISLGGELDMDVLESLGKSGSYQASDASELKATFTKAAQQAKALQKRIYVLGYCSPKLAGVHQLTIEVLGGKGISPPIEFDASAFNNDFATCSSLLFEQACATKSCGGLLCGACAAGVECLTDDRCACDGLICGSEAGRVCGECSGATEYCTADQTSCTEACEGLICGEGVVDCDLTWVGSDCCAAHDTGGCDSPSVEEFICGFVDESCCADSWDADCAQYAELYTGACDEGQATSDCHLSDISCGTCEEGTYCGDEQTSCDDSCGGYVCGDSPVDETDCGECAGGSYCAVDQSACLDSCADIGCGISSVDGWDCGTCEDGSYCAEDQSACLDSCADIGCGISSVDGWDCGTCEDGSYCPADQSACVDVCGDLVCGVKSYLGGGEDADEVPVSLFFDGYAFSNWYYYIWDDFGFYWESDLQDAGWGDGVEAQVSLPPGDYVLEVDSWNCDMGFEITLQSPCGLWTMVEVSGCGSQSYFTVETCPLGAEIELSCGECESGTYCAEDQTACLDSCADLECGASPIDGADCGQCAEALFCTGENLCVAPCEGLVCGQSPLDGSECGTCEDGSYCSADQTECGDPCVGLACGLSPIDGTSCGSCDGGTVCSTDQTECEDACGEKVCGTQEIDPCLTQDSPVTVYAEMWGNVGGDWQYDIQSAETGESILSAWEEPWGDGWFLLDFDLPLGDYLLVMTAPSCDMFIDIYMSSDCGLVLWASASGCDSTLPFTITTCGSQESCPEQVPCGTCGDGTYCSADQLSCQEGTPQTLVKLTADGDFFAETESLWWLADSAGNTYVSFGSGPKSSTKIEELLLPGGETFSIHVSDSYGDGGLGVQVTACGNEIALVQQWNYTYSSQDSFVVPNCGGPPPAGDPGVIQYDDGTFEEMIGTGAGSHTYEIMTRFTPESWPVTVVGVDLYFADEMNEWSSYVSVGESIDVLGCSSASTNGSKLIANVTHESASNINGMDAFHTYTFDTPMVVNSGDFAAGFRISFNGQKYPAAMDYTNPADRAYIRDMGVDLDNNGIAEDIEGAFLNMGTLGFDGNWGIRARVEY